MCFLFERFFDVEENIKISHISHINHISYIRLIYLIIQNLYKFSTQTVFGAIICMTGMAICLKRTTHNNALFVTVFILKFSKINPISG